MALTPMQYKSYVWPHNPRTYRITYQRQVAVQKVPFGRYALQDLGLTRRVMEGEGEFFGPEAYDEFRKLASVFYQEGPGMLIHPVWQSANVYFVALALAQEPKQDYVRYTFTFWEDENRYRQKLVPVGQKKTTGTKLCGEWRRGCRGGVSYRDPGRDALGDRPEPGDELGRVAGTESSAEEPEPDLGRPTAAREVKGGSRDDGMAAELL